MKTFKKSDAPVQLTKNFSSHEFKCPCPRCTEFTVDLDHINKLQALRDKVGKPITIDSAFRCPEHNKEVGGEPHSVHMLGHATDIKIPGYTPNQVADMCEGFDGLGRYDTFTHCDSRGTPARWDRRTKKDQSQDAQPQLPDGPSDEEINKILKDLE